MGLNWDKGLRKNKDVLTLRCLSTGLPLQLCACAAAPALLMTNIFLSFTYLKSYLTWCQDRHFCAFKNIWRNYWKITNSCELLILIFLFWYFVTPKSHLWKFYKPLLPVCGLTRVSIFPCFKSSFYVILPINLISCQYVSICFSFLF